MSSMHYVHTIFLLVFVITFGAVIYMRKRILHSSRGVHRLKLLSLVMLLILGGIAVIQFYLSPNTARLGEVAVYGVLGLILYFQMSKSPTESESRQQYELEPGRCGRGGYDLTGNVSGVCPECGWKIAGPSAQYEKPEWAMWWRRWDIEYLDNWKRTLATCLLFVVTFAAVALWLLIAKGVVVFGLVAALMASNFLLNAVRVGAYGRRRAGTRSS
jgi:hypothetical protein